jgi:hypothetical protein
VQHTIRITNLRNFALLTLTLLLLAGCTLPLIRPEETSAPVEAAAPAAPEEAVATAVQQALAEQLGVEPAAVTIIDVEAAEWPDGCLGLAKSDEMCAAVIVPGFKVTLSADGAEYVFHTNHDGSQSRQAESTE